MLALIPQDEVLGIWGILKNSVPSVLHKRVQTKTSRIKHKAYVDLDHVLAPVEVDNLIYNPNLLKVLIQ